ncbi:MAG: hypothetical protein KDE09_11980, partial [Anaerolineales bacterium]|nr:hypothetical protein [Anaerolineales bacterium]
TERPIYQPGQTVFFKGIIRQDNDALVENVAAGVPVTAVLYDSRNNELSRQELLTNDFGTVNGAFQLADGAALGDYQVRLSAYDVTERLSIQVEAYRKPDFAVDLTLSTDRAAVDDIINVTVDSSYFFGGPVSGAGVTVNVWQVADYDYWSNKRVLRSGQTDEAGLFTAEFSGNETGKYIVEAVVANGSSYTVASSAAIELFPAAHQISVQRGSYLQQPNTPFTVRATLLDLTGAPAANRPVEFVFYRYSRSSHRYSLEAERLSVQTDSRGVASLTLSLPEADWYRVLARSADPAGRVVSGERWFLVWSRSWQGYLAQDDSLRISPDRDSYLPGDTATFIIESEYSGPALLTLERGAVYDVLPVALTAPITFVELPIQAHYAPNVHATIQHWDPLDNELTQRTYRSVPDLMLRVATTEVTVPATDRLLNVEIIQDRESYKPGETANVTLRVTNWQGVPVSAEIELAVVDEAIFALAADNVTPLYDAFYFNRPDQVRTLDNMRPQRSLWIPYGGGMGGGGGDYFDGPRREFRDTAAYFPALRTDANGEVQVAIPLPDNLTTWRLTARAVTGDTQIGTMQEQLLVTQDLLLQPLLPAQLVEGDTIQLSALLHNRTGTALTLAATLALADETALALRGSAVQEVVLPAGGQQLIGWPIEALTASEALVTITMTNAEGQIVDQVELPLPVVRRAVHSVTSEAGQLGAELATTVTIPDSELREAYVAVTLNRTIASSLLDGLEDLTGYPYGCVEQTMSRALPNAVVSRALTQLNVVDPVRFASLTPYIEASVQRLYGFQHGDGGWGWWFSDPTHDYQTAWVVFGLAQTAESGYPVNETVLANGSDWLARHLTEMDERTRAFALYAMALTGRYELNETRILAAAPDRLDSFSVAALALTLHEAGYAAEAQQLIDYLLASRPAGQSYWSGDIEDGYYTRKTMASDVRNTAMVLTALARIRPAAPQIDEIADWLMGQRQAFGWGTTNETSFAIIALTDYLVSRSEFSEQAAYEVWWGDELVASGTIGPEAPQASVAIPLAELTPGEFPLRVTQTGQGPLYYRVDTHLYEQASPGAAAGPVAVTRSYRLPAAGEPTLSFQPGDLVRVELKVVVSEAAAYVLVEDKVPAGLEPINPGLDTSSGEAQQHYGSHYSYLEMRDGRVSFFITELAPGTHTFVYFARVVQSGTFSAMPAEMYAMYDLTVWGRSAGAIVEIPPGG